MSRNLCSEDGASEQRAVQVKVSEETQHEGPEVGQSMALSRQ